MCAGGDIVSSNIRSTVYEVSMPAKGPIIQCSVRCRKCKGSTNEWSSTVVGNMSLTPHSINYIAAWSLNNGDISGSSILCSRVLYFYRTRTDVAWRVDTRCCDGRTHCGIIWARNEPTIIYGINWPKQPCGRIL